MESIEIIDKKKEDLVRYCSEPKFLSDFAKFMKNNNLDNLCKNHPLDDLGIDSLNYQHLTINLLEDEKFKNILLKRKWKAGDVQPFLENYLKAIAGRKKSNRVSTSTTSISHTTSSRMHPTPHDLSASDHHTIETHSDERDHLARFEIKSSFETTLGGALKIDSKATNHNGVYILYSRALIKFAGVKERDYIDEIQKIIDAGEGEIEEHIPRMMEAWGIKKAELLTFYGIGIIHLKLKNNKEMTAYCMATNVNIKSGSVGSYSTTQDKSDVGSQHHVEMICLDYMNSIIEENNLQDSIDLNASHLTVYSGNRKPPCPGCKRYFEAHAKYLKNKVPVVH